MIALVGPRGAGKTAAGRLAAEELSRPFLDLDSAIEAAGGRSVAELLAESEPRFRDLEAGALARALASGPESLVLATGGGAPLRPESAALLRERARVVYLAASAATLRERLRARGAGPPLLRRDALEEIGDVLAAREPLYRALAHATIETDGLGLADVAGAIAADALLAGR